MKKLALGKGIASLIHDSETPHEVVSQALKQMNAEDDAFTPKDFTMSPLLMDLESIRVNPNQPRKIFREKELEELANSIKENGIIQPLIVAQMDNGFELIAGERRYRAAKSIGLEKVPVVVKKVTDREKLIMSIIENVQRSDLNCVEEALAYFQLMDDFKLTQEEVAKKLGKERSTVANFLRVLKLPRPAIDLLQRDQLTFGHAKILASVKDENKLVLFATKCADNNLTVRDLEKMIKNDEKQKVEAKTEEVVPAVNLDQLRQQLEQKTAFHIGIDVKKKGNGEITFKFNNEAEFNQIYEYLMGR